MSGPYGHDGEFAVTLCVAFLSLCLVGAITEAYLDYRSSRIHRKGGF